MISRQIARQFIAQQPKSSSAMFSRETRRVFINKRGFASFTSSDYEHIIVEKKEGRVALVQLNRPKALNSE